MENYLIVYPLLREIEYLKQKEKEVQTQIDELPKGSIHQQNGHYYLKYYENGKTITKYLKDYDECKLNLLSVQLKDRKTLKRTLKDIKEAIKVFSKLIVKYGLKGNYNTQLKEL